MRLVEIAGELNVSLQSLVKKLNENGFNASLNPNYKLSEEEYEYLKKTFSETTTVSKEKDTVSHSVDSTLYNIVNNKLKFNESKNSTLQNQDHVFKQNDKNNSKHIFTKDSIENNRDNQEKQNDVEKSTNNEIFKKKINIIGTIDIDKINKSNSFRNVNISHKNNRIFRNNDVSSKREEDEKKKQIKSVHTYSEKQQWNNIHSNTSNSQKIEDNNNINNTQKTKENSDVSQKHNLSKKTTGAKITLEKLKEYKKKKNEKITNKLSEDNKIKRTITISNIVTLHDLSGLLNCEIDVVKKKVEEFIPIFSIYQKLDNDVISIIAEEFGYNVIYNNILTDNKTDNKISTKKDDNNTTVSLHKKVPVVAIMGHIDHGKTTLLDYICKSSVSKVESGGITQHIKAYNVTTKNGDKMTIIDTPGHEVFTSMRARGISIADIIIVVIAVDSGVQEQTIEILKQIKLANKPVVFAFNKADKQVPNIDNIKNDLSKLNFDTEDWGGKYQYQKISALKGDGVDDLLDKVILEVDMLDLKVNYDCKSSGVVLESFSDRGTGAHNTLLIQNGILKTGDFIVAGDIYGKARILKDMSGNIVKEAYPSDPITVIGLGSSAKAGENFIVVKDEKEAKKVSYEYSKILREQNIKSQQKRTFESYKNKIANEDKCINVIINADFDGSVQALIELFFKISSNNEFKINVVKTNIGDVVESIVNLAEITNSLIIGFNVKISSATSKIAKKKNVQVKIYSVIYDISDEIQKIIKDRLNQNAELVSVAKAEVIQVFKINKVGTVAGCLVKEGTAHYSDTVNIIRNGEKIFTGEIKSLKNHNADVKEVNCDTECGICIKNFSNFEKADVIEFMQNKSK